MDLDYILPFAALPENPDDVGQYSTPHGRRQEQEGQT